MRFNTFDREDVNQISDFQGASLNLSNANLSNLPVNNTGRVKFNGALFDTNTPTPNINPNNAAKQAFNYYKTKGVNPKVAAGIVGNLFVESGFNSRANGDGGTSHGLAQWHNERFNGLKRYAASKGKNWDDHNTQLDYVLDENPNIIRNMERAKDEREASMIFTNQFERPNPKQANYAKRVGMASSIMKFGYGGDPKQIAKASSTNVNKPMLPYGAKHYNKPNTDPSLYYQIDPNGTKTDLKYIDEDINAATDKNKPYLKRVRANIVNYQNTQASAINAIHDISNKPTVNNLEGQTIVDGKAYDSRAYFMPNTNTMYLGNDRVNDFIAESAHGLQYKYGVNPTRERMDNLGNNVHGYESGYNRVGSIEHEAHSVIEPRLRNIYTRMTNNPDLSKYSKKKGFGGYLKKFGLGGNQLDAISSGLGFLGSTVNLTDTNKRYRDKGTSALSGALSGAGTGASIGTALLPGIGTGIGAGIGALTGGVTSFMEADAEQRRYEEGLKTDSDNFLKFMRDRTKATMNQMVTNSTRYGFGGEPESYGNLTKYL